MLPATWRCLCPPPLLPSHKDPRSPALQCACAGRSLGKRQDIPVHSGWSDCLGRGPLGPQSRAITGYSPGGGPCCLVPHAGLCSLGGAGTGRGPLCLVSE